MITGGLRCIPGLLAGGDLSAAASQYKAVKLTAPNTVALCAATTDKPIGILQNRPNVNQPATVAYAGLSQWQTTAVLQPGTIVATQAAGQAQTASAGQYPVGQVVDPGGGQAGDLMTVLISCANLQAI
jgi:hypothetical protein